VVPEGYHLFLVGIDMPVGYALASANLDLITATGRTPMALSGLRSPWPAHFAVVGVLAEPGTTRLAVWLPGTYRLELRFGPGAIDRSIEIVIPRPPGSG
jgi:hypothetical protein